VESKGRPIKRRWLANAKLPTRLRLGELWRYSRRFPGVLGVRSLQSASCGGILCVARTRYLGFV
jgi:hypothetical protein